jgi:hypothetical protein
LLIYRNNKAQIPNTVLETRKKKIIIIFSETKK